jgi:hypothetical protein
MAAGSSNDSLEQTKLPFLNPFLLPEIGQHHHYHKQHKYQDCRIAPGKLELGHEPKVHPVNTGQKCEGNEYRRDDGEKLDHLI